VTRIPITMCHGLSSQGDFPLTADHLDQLVRIAHDLSFSSINYDELAAWRSEGADLPARPIMLVCVRSSKLSPAAELARATRGHLIRTS